VASLVNEYHHAVDDKKWELTFSDEFNGPKGNAPDEKKWGRDLGAQGYGNHELEDYTDGNRNAFLDGDGNLIIEARKEPSGTAKPHYTSARLKTEGKFAQAYGRFEARIKLPIGQGIWPAFWMLGDNIGRVGWPDSGEIDILEQRGQHPSTVLGTLHGPGYSGGAGKTANTTLEHGTLHDDFHIYAVEWTPESIKWYLDDKCYHTVTPADLHGKKWVFDHPFFVILNCAVGGDFVGSPNETTKFPQRLVVDYVRVYKAKG